MLLTLLLCFFSCGKSFAQADKEISFEKKKACVDSLVDCYRSVHNSFFTKTSALPKFFNSFIELEAQHQEFEKRGYGELYNKIHNWGDSLLREGFTKNGYLSFDLEHFLLIFQSYPAFEKHGYNEVYNNIYNWADSILTNGNKIYYHTMIFQNYWDTFYQLGCIEEFMESDEYAEYKRKGYNRPFDQYYFELDSLLKTDIDDFRYGNSHEEFDKFLRFFRYDEGRLCLYDSVINNCQIKDNANKELFTNRFVVIDSMFRKGLEWNIDEEEYYRLAEEMFLNRRFYIPKLLYEDEEYNKLLYLGPSENLESFRMDCPFLDFDCDSVEVELIKISHDSITDKFYTKGVNYEVLSTHDYKLYQFTPYIKGRKLTELSETYYSGRIQRKIKNFSYKKHYVECNFPNDYYPCLFGSLEKVDSACPILTHVPKDYFEIVVPGDSLDYTLWDFYYDKKALVISYFDNDIISYRTGVYDFDTKGLTLEYQLREEDYERVRDYHTNKIFFTKEGLFFTFYGNVECNCHPYYTYYLDWEVVPWTDLEKMAKPGSKLMKIVKRNLKK